MRTTEAGTHGGHGDSTSLFMVADASISLPVDSLLVASNDAMWRRSDAFACSHGHECASPSSLPAGIGSCAATHHDGDPGNNGYWGPCLLWCNRQAAGPVLCEAAAMALHEANLASVKAMAAFGGHQ